MLSYKPNGKRSPGRPRRRWMSQVWGAATDESPMHEVEEEEEEEEEETVQGSKYCPSKSC
jgi:hypothetical protein